MDQQPTGETVGAASSRLTAIGKYQLIARLGHGGMATVYLALIAGPAGFNKLMVVKVLRDDTLGGSEEAVRMFWNEARLSAQLVHPNIVHTFEVGQSEGRYFLAMEYLEGQTLRALQDRAAPHGGIALHESLRILAEAARGLHYSHELRNFKGEPLGVVHRDVSPQNLFLTYDGQVKVLDFGIAKMRDSEFLTQVGVIKGKLEYLAPEQLRGEEIDGRADVFALGAMMCEAITGQRFAGGRKVADVAKVHTRLSGGERKVRDIKPDAPEALLGIIERAIAVSPSDRFESAGVFADAIEHYLEGLPSKPSTKTLAAFMKPLYEADRTKMHQVIEAQIERTRQGQLSPADTSLDLLKLNTEVASSSGVFLGGEGSPRSAVTPVGGSPLLVPLAAPAPKPRRGWKTSAILVVVVIGIAVVALRPWQGEPAAPGAVPLLPAPTITAEPPATNAKPPVPVDEHESVARSVELNVVVTPNDAQVTIDGAPLVTPFHGRFRKDAAFHLLEAVAPGRRPFKRLIPFDRDQAIAIELPDAPAAPQRRVVRAGSNDRSAPEPVTQREESAQPAVAAAPSRTAPVEANEPGTGMAPAGSAIKRRGLIVSDPYAPKKL